MNLDAPLIDLAIEHKPILVSPQTPLLDVILLMNQHQAHTKSDSENESSSSCSCVLVMEGKELLGIFTERDIVRLTAKDVNLKHLKIAEVMIQPVITLDKSALNDIFAFLFLFRRYRIRHLPIIGDEGNIVGVASRESIRKVLRPDNFLKMRRVADVMRKDIISAPPFVSVLEIAQLMAKHQISCVVITEQDKNDRQSLKALPVGIITERDIVQFQALEINLSQTKAQEVMSSPLFLVSPEDSLLDAHKQMQRLHVRRLVVSWNWGQELGIVTLTSLLKIFDPIEMYGVIQTLQQTIKQLETEKAQLLEQLSANSEQ